MTMATGDRPFVFYEPSGQRWRRVRYAILGAVVLLSIVLGLTLVSVVVNPNLPPLRLGVEAHSPQLVRMRHVVSSDRSGPGVQSPRSRPEASPGASAGRRVVLGYYVNWDAASIVSLRLNLHALTHLVPQWFTLQDAHGALEDEADPEVIKLAADARVPILAMVTNFRAGWQADELHDLLTDPAARNTLIDNVYSNLIEHGFAGVNIDFEGLRAADRERMTALMRELRARLQPAGLLLTQSVPADDAAYDLKALSALNDYLVIMMYDEHSAASGPGPVASAEWFETALARVARTVPPGKTVIALGNYGYEWAAGSPQGTEITFTGVMSRARYSQAGIAWDEAAANPVLRYQADDGPHEVWFLDAVTALNELRAVARSGVRGVGLWRLGAEDPGVWTVLAQQASPTDESHLRPLTRLDAQKAVMQYGDGEVLRVVDTPKNGARQVWQTSGGGFAERYTRYPGYFAIHSAGAGPEPVIALTFDDGPDDRYTPQILDILKNRQVPATFFIVGSQAERLAGLLQRTYNEGHELGNHTYSHPDLAGISLERTRLELNATQRIIQHTLGVSTSLFRPPYQTDSEPQTPEEIEPIARAERLGYLTVAARIDPRDWEPGITPEAIVTEVLAEREQGRIVLLHDGGGDRSATVEALPRLIDQLRAAGYRFVRVSELIGKTRAEVMPAYSRRELGWAGVAGVTFGLKGSLTTVVMVLFVATIYLVLFRVAVYGPVAAWQKRRARSLRFDLAFAPPVSVVVPAHNEERVLVGAVQSILDNGYASFEVVIVDDGSTDRTLEVLRGAFAGDGRVRVHSQPKAGKAAALKTAVALARYEILVAIDADTSLRPGTLAKLVRHFADTRVGAVSGNARVGNRRTWLTRFQSIEYICAFNLERRALDVVNAITVVPGAVGAWRKELIQRVGGFTDDTLAEDTDLTLAIRRLGYRIRYDGEAVAYTEVPQTTAALAQQRFRWLFGTLQAAWKHRDAMFRPRYGSLGFVALPSIWLFQLVLPLVSPLAELAMLLALFSGHWPIVLAYGSLLFAAELLGALVSYRLEGVWSVDLLLLFVQRVFYRQLLLYVSAKAIVSAIRGRRIAWHKLDRAGSWPRLPLAPPVGVADA
jgi:cellulose synthase/poly-beta-1,6-N-acetylglucosamine synthase-like glycosyltransferase/spore germination protein YaaH/peptidoglycan/xylan/chitin deacetylase (PgdA/CDA1 family)